MSGDQARRRSTTWQWLCNILSTALTAAIGTALLVLLIVLFYELNLTGSAADWLATLFNAVVAITAIAAFVVARSWLPQLTTQEGYKEAIQLVNEQYIQLGPDNSLGQSAEAAMKAFREQNENNASASLSSYSEALNNFSVYLQAADAVLHEIKKTQFRLNTYGLTEAPNYEKPLETMIKEFRASLTEGNRLLDLLFENYECRCKAQMPTRYNELNTHHLILGLKANETAALIEEQYQRFTTASANMVAAHQAVFSEKPTIGELFVPRKRRS